MRALLLVGVLALACIPHAPPRPFARALPGGVHLDMRGRFALTAEGTLRLDLANPCFVETQGTGLDNPSKIFQEPCDPQTLAAIDVIARVPWHPPIHGRWSGRQQVVFEPDWKATGIDPLADDAMALAARPWIVSGTVWTPSRSDAAAIVKQVADATETEIDAVRGGPSPDLEVSHFEVEGNALGVGESSTIVVQIANRGPGIAYRVAATIRSSSDALHDRRLSFGMIRPGSAKLRRLTVAIPETETAPDAMLVVAVSEANGATTRNASLRVAFAADTRAPALALQCAAGGDGTPSTAFDAGQSIPVRCTVSNRGNATAKSVALEVSIAGRSPTLVAPQSIAIAQQAAFEATVAVPRELPIDTAVEIAITARDRSSGGTARAVIKGVVRKPRLCVPGQLTREQYRAKLADLRSALTAGDLTQAQFDRYDSELVSCLR